MRLREPGDLNSTVSHGNVIQADEIVDEYKIHEADKVKCFYNLRKKYGQLMYLENLAKVCL